METAAGTLQSKWSPSFRFPTSIASYDSSSSFSVPPGMMDDLPFSLEDLPPEIRNKIDDIIEKNEDLDTQLDAIDALLFANRPQAKADSSSKFDLGNESGIGSDSDSGHGVIPAPDPLTVSPLPSRAREELIENAKTFGPLLRTSALNDDVDDFISRILVPPPPHLTGSPVRQSSPSKELTFAPRSTLSTDIHPSVTSSSLSTTPTITRRGIIERDLPIHLPPPPLEFGGSPKKPARVPETPPLNEVVTAVKTGQNFFVTLDVPRSLLSNGSSTGDSSHSNVTRVHIGKEEKQLPVNMTSVPILKPVHRQTDATMESSAGRPSHLYAWNKTSELASIRESPPDKPSDSKKSFSLPSAPQRPSELDVSRDKQPRFWKKGKEKFVSSDLISTPPRYSQVTSGPTVESRRKKWRPTSAVLPEGGRIGGSLDSGNQAKARSENENSDAEDVDEDRKGAASDDDFSSIVVMRIKKGKQAQTPKIDSRTLKAHSMLSLYDPSSDLKGRSKDKKPVKAKVKTKPKLDPFAFFRGKHGKHHHPDVRERPSSERPLSMSALDPRDSEMEPLRSSDYLFLVPPPLSFRSSIPSPSLYSSLDPRSRQMRSSPGPRDISEIYRIDVRDLQVGDRRPPMTFGTFRGEIQPIKWSEERAKFPVSNRWSHMTFEEIESPSRDALRPPSALSSTCSLPAHLSQFDTSGSGGGLLNSATTSRDPVQQRRRRRPSPPTDEPHKVHQTIAKTELAKQSSPSILILDGDSTPVFKVRTTRAVTPEPQSTRVVTPTEPQVFTPSTTTAGTRLSIASSCFSNAISENCTENGSISRRNGNSTPIFLPIPHNQYLTPSYSNPRLDAMKTVPGRLSPRPSSARSSPCPSATSVETSISGSDKDDVDSVNWNGLEEVLVLQTTYETDIAGARAEDDVRRMLSSLEAQREWLLSAGSTSYSSPPKVFQVRKDSLATQSRRLVTEAKLMVSAATRSMQELTSTLTSVVHTVAKVFDSCRQVLAVLPPGVRRMILLDQVLDVGRMFLETLISANLAAGRRHDDPAMEQLMAHTTALAQALFRQVNTTKSLDNEA